MQAPHFADQRVYSLLQEPPHQTLNAPVVNPISGPWMEKISALAFAILPNLKFSAWQISTQ